MVRKILDIFSKRKTSGRNPGKIIVDFREKNSLVPAELMKLGFNVEFRQLPVADYLVSDVAVERKTISDLKSSIINKRIISQLMELKQFENKLLLIEGILDEELYSSGIHENALRGFLLSVALQFKVPLIFTYDEKDSAKYLSVLEKRKGKVESGLRASKIFLSRAEQLQFVLEGFPNVGPVVAKKLLERFGSLRRVFNASEEDLEKVLGKRAGEFRSLLD